MNHLAYFVLFFAMLVAPTRAFAHAIGVDCKLRAGKVEVEAYFDDDSPAAKAKVEARDAEDKVIANGLTDAKGRWSFPAPMPGKYTVHVDAGAGHRAKKTIQIPAANAELEPNGTASISPPSEPREDAPSVGDGPTRAEFTQTPWLKVAMGLAVIGVGSVVVILGMGWIRHG